VLFRNQLSGPASLAFTFALAALPPVHFSGKGDCDVLEVWANASTRVAVGANASYTLRPRQAIMLRVGDCK
jgi:hypothetical protein